LVTSLTKAEELLVDEGIGQAQLELNHPNEAFMSAQTAYNLCISSSHQTSSAFAISGFVLKCKKAKWDVHERERLRRRGELVSELEAKLEEDRKRELSNLEERRLTGDIGQVAAAEEADIINETQRKKINELKNSFAISDPEHLAKRVTAPADEGDELR